MTNFTPYSALAGGILIGAAATLLLWLNGRVAGVSGILGGVLTRPYAANAWRAFFLLGLVLGAAIYGTLYPAAVIGRPGNSLLLTLAAGLLVGYGTAQANGCTSGHGVCGLARLSWRSLLATLTFLSCGIITVYLARHLIGGAS